MLELYFDYTGRFEWLYTVTANIRHNVRGNQTQPGLVCLNKAAFFRAGEKVDFCGTWTCNLQLGTLMLYLLSQEAHLVSTTTSSAPITLPSTQMLPTLVGCKFSPKNTSLHPNAAYSGGLWTCGRAHRMGFLAQKVEHQCTKLKVAGSSPTEVHFFSCPEKCCFIQTNQARLGLVAPDLINHYVWYLQCLYSHSNRPV